jgi:hypothetical protein
MLTSKDQQNEKYTHNLKADVGRLSRKSLWKIFLFVVSLPVAPNIVRNREQIIIILLSVPANYFEYNPAQS